jgi:hypothetical protein
LAAGVPCDIWRFSCEMPDQLRKLMAQGQVKKAAAEARAESTDIPRMNVSPKRGRGIWISDENPERGESRTAEAEPGAHSLISKTGGLRFGGARQQPRHDSPVTIAATGEFMFLSRCRRKGGNLLFGLSLVPGQRHPFTNNCSACLVFGSHLSKPFELWIRTAEA